MFKAPNYAAIVFHLPYDTTEIVPRPQNFDFIKSHGLSQEILNVPRFHV